MSHESVKSNRTGKRTRYWVPILGYSIKVLEALSVSNTDLTLHQVSKMAGVGKTSVFRILYTLQKTGYVEKDASTGKYRLAPKLLDLAWTARPATDLSTVARPYLRELRNKFGETANLAVHSGGEVIYTEVVESRNAFRMSETAGSRAPWHSTAVGKSIAAFLPSESRNQLLKNHDFQRFTRYTITNRRKFKEELRKIKEVGHSLDKEETELGAFCIAFPILNDEAIAVGAISISGPRARIRAKRKEITAALRKVSAAVSKSTSIPEQGSELVQS